MADDQKLVETVARAMARWDMNLEDQWEGWKDGAAEVLAAINASGTHWVAPWDVTREISAAVDRETEGNCRESVVPQVFSIARTAYLAKTETKP